MTTTKSNPFGDVAKMSREELVQGMRAFNPFGDFRNWTEEELSRILAKHLEAERQR